MNPARVRTAVLVSGRGSNLRALVAASRAPDFPAEVALVVSNEPDAPGLRVAVENGVPVATVPHRSYPSRPAFEEALHATLVAKGIALVCLAGFMRLLTAGFVDRWAGRIISVHPALLPAFRGLDTHARALAAGVKIHGCTVHRVVSELDAGPIIAQAAVPVLPGDDIETLAARVLAQEHVIFPRALRLVARSLAAGRGEPGVSLGAFVDPAAALVVPGGA